MTRRSEAQSSVQNAPAIPLPNVSDAPWYVRFTEVPRVRPGLYVDEEDLPVSVLDFALHGLPVFYHQVFTDSEAQKLERKGERMEIGPDSGVIEGDLELMQANKIKALECWSRLRTAIHG